eukprot:632403-Alexandrium_andersonii.AAC.1
MSASLVGSEMCIRDRKGGGKANFAVEQNADEEVRQGQPEIDGTPSFENSCLLYTSDAADDM